MESVKLAEFYRSVSSFPRTETELSFVAEKLCQLIQASFVAIYSTHSANGSSGKLGFKFADAGAADKANSGVFEEFLKKQIQHADEVLARAGTNGGSIRQIQVPLESLPWGSIAPANHLAVAHIRENLRLSTTQKEGRRTQDYGFVIVGCTRPLSGKGEVLLMSIAQYLSELAIVAELEAAIQLRAQFLSIASHELKTPLTSIYGVLQLQERMLRMKKDEDPRQQLERQHSYLKMVIRQVERLNELIDGLLDVSRIQSGRFVVEPSDADVASILRETAGSRLQIISQEAGVQLEVDSPEHLSAWVDPVRMEEVITNLVMNAIRFSPEGGVVWIRLAEQGEGAFRLTVRDQGPAVPIEDRERIFQPFERAQRTSRLGGLGLGLFVSRQIAQLHGGNVTLLESVPGKGNVFEAYFPARSVSLVSATA